MSVSTRRLAVATLLTGLVAGLVGLACMRRGHILIGVDRDCCDAHVGGRAAHAQSDFATVGDKDSINCSHASP